MHAWLERLPFDVGGGAFVVLIVALAVTIVGHALVFLVLRGVARRTNSIGGRSAVRRCRLPTLAILLLLVLQIFAPPLALPAGVATVVDRLLAILLIVAVAWLLIRVTRVGRDVIDHHWNIHAADNLRARQITTQYEMLRRIVVVVIVVLALASVLMTFERIRQLGAGILASAGIAGIILGFAAQKTLGTFIAGLQIALTQPIRLDDVLVVEGEWGRVEEINLTYVVLRIWDQRRLILPITYFLEKPFQNWTRVSADIIGTVFLSLDATVPVDAIRAEVARLVQANANWDGKVQGVQVTSVTEKTIEVRALMSAADSGKAWDLRCEVREQLVAFVRDRYPEALPRLRAQVRTLE